MSKQQSNSPARGGFSDIRVRLFIMATLILILAFIPFLGIIGSACFVLTFALFVAIKISAYQHGNAKSMYLHYQAMDKLYNRGLKAAEYNRLIKSYDEMHEHKKSNHNDNKNDLKLVLHPIGQK